MLANWLNTEGIKLKNFLRIEVTAKDLFDAILLKPGDSIEFEGKSMTVLERHPNYVLFQGVKNRCCIQNWELIQNQK